MSEDLAGFVTVANADESVFEGVLENDMLIYPETSNQRIFLGTKSNAAPVLIIGSNVLKVLGDLDFDGVLKQDGQAYIGSQWSNDGANVFLLSSNVGIGLSNPAFALDVTGDLNFSGMLRQGGVPYIGSQWSNNGNNVFIMESNIGIGVSNPQADLHVASNLRIDGSIQCGNAMQFTGIEFIPGTIANNYTNLVASTSNIKGYCNADYGTLFSIDNNTSSDAFKWMAGTSNIMCLTGEGKLGVSTSTPQYALDVNGDLNFTGILLQGGVPYVGSQWSNNSTSVFILDSNVGIQTSNPNYALDVNGDINFEGILRQGGVPYVGSQWSNDGTNVFLLESNVGIGVSNPLRTLHVKGDVQFDSNVYLGKQLEFRSLRILRSDEGSDVFNTTTTITSIPGFSNTSSGIQFTVNTNSASTYFSFLGDTTEVVRLQGDGKLGIGTTAPAEKLDVNGNIATSGTARITNTGALQNVTADAGIITSGTLPVSRGGTGAATLTANKVLVGNTTSAPLQPTNLHWDDANTRLGIGTVTPAHTIDINGNVATAGTARITNTGALQNVTADASIITSGVFNVANGGTGASTLTANKVLVGNNTSAPLQPTNLHWDNANSRLGIGTITPTVALDVNGTIKSASYSLSNTSFSTNGNDIFINTNGASTITLRPNGNGSATNQTEFGSTGTVFNAGVTVTGNLSVSAQFTRPAVPAFRVKNSGGTYPQVGVGTFNKLPNMNSVLLNNGSYYNSTTQRFVAPIAGYYSIQGCAMLGTSPGAVNYLSSAIAVNGTVIVFTQVLRSASGIYTSAFVSTVVYLAVNDYVELYGNAQLEFLLSVDPGTFLSGYFIG